VKATPRLLIVLAGGLAWAAFSVPSNAATVNGATISQHDLNSDVNAIAGSEYYQCYLNSEAYLSSNGSQQLPPSSAPARASTPGTPDRHDRLRGQLPRDRDRPPAPAASGARAPRQCDPGRPGDRPFQPDQEISSVMSEILQTQQGRDVRYGAASPARR